MILTSHTALGRPRSPLLTKPLPRPRPHLGYPTPHRMTPLGPPHCPHPCPGSRLTHRVPHRITHVAPLPLLSPHLLGLGRGGWERSHLSPVPPPSFWRDKVMATKRTIVTVAVSGLHPCAPARNSFIPSTNAGLVPTWGPSEPGRAPTPGGPTLGLSFHIHPRKRPGPSQPHHLEILDPEQPKSRYGAWGDRPMLARQGPKEQGSCPALAPQSSQDWRFPGAPGGSE